VLPKEHRLTSNRDFETVYKRGKGYVHRLLVMRVLKRDGPQPPRFGFSTSPKLGTTAVRNRAKRQLREAVRSLRAEIRGEGFDAVIIGRPAIRRSAFAEIRVAAQELFRKAGLVEEVR